MLGQLDRTIWFGWLNDAVATFGQQKCTECQKERKTVDCPHRVVLIINHDSFTFIPFAKMISYFNQKSIGVGPATTQRFSLSFSLSSVDSASVSACKTIFGRSLFMQPLRLLSPTATHPPSPPNSRGLMILLIKSLVQNHQCLGQNRRFLFRTNFLVKCWPPEEWGWEFIFYSDSALLVCPMLVQ